MITLRHLRYLAAGLLAVTLAWTVLPTSAEAGGSQPNSDFTIQTREKINVWGDGPDYGTWTMTGVEHDSGAVSGGTAYITHMRFYGDLGEMYLDTYYENGLTFEVVYGTGVYESWVGAVGTYSIWYGREDRNGYRAVKRRLEGFLPVAP